VAVSGQLSIPAALPPWEKVPVPSEEEVGWGPESTHFGHVKDPVSLSGNATKFLSSACPTLTKKPTTQYGLSGLRKFSHNAESKQFYREKALPEQPR